MNLPDCMETDDSRGRSNRDFRTFRSLSLCKHAVAARLRCGQRDLAGYVLACRSILAKASLTLAWCCIRLIVRGDPFRLT